MTGIDLAVAADTSAAMSAIKRGLIDPLEDVSEILEKIGDQRDTEQLERDMRDAQRRTEDAKDEIRDLRDELARTGRAGKAAGDDIDDGMRKGAKRAGEATGAFKDEAIQNFSEVASSFNGDVTQMADGVQGLTGGLASALTPGIGIPVAIVGALAGAFLNSWITASEDSEQRVEDMFARMTEAGAKFASESQVKEAIEDLDTESVAKGLERARDLSIEEGAVLRAMVGDTQAIAAINAELVRRKKEEVDAIRESGVGLDEQATKIDAANTKYAEQSDWLRDIQRDTETAGQKWDAVNAALDYTGGKVSTLSDQIAGLNGSKVTIYADINASAVYQKYDQIKRDLQSRGINVPITVQDTRGGRTWQ